MYLVDNHLIVSHSAIIESFIDNLLSESTLTVY